MHALAQRRALDPPACIHCQAPCAQTVRFAVNGRAPTLATAAMALAAAASHPCQSLVLRPSCCTRLFQPDIGHLLACAEGGPRHANVTRSRVLSLPRGLYLSALLPLACLPPHPQLASLAIRMQHVHVRRRAREGQSTRLPGLDHSASPWRWCSYGLFLQ